jgi:hypothetical protein
VDTVCCANQQLHLLYMHATYNPCVLCIFLRQSTNVPLLAALHSCNHLPSRDRSSAVTSSDSMSACCSAAAASESSGAGLVSLGFGGIDVNGVWGCQSGHGLDGSNCCCCWELSQCCCLAWAEGASGSTLADAACMRRYTTCQQPVRGSVHASAVQSTAQLLFTVSPF